MVIMFSATFNHISAISWRSVFIENSVKTCRCSMLIDIRNMFCVFQLIWPGELVELPCKFSEYDYTNSGHFLPADLAYHMNERGRECDNMMVFNMLDKDGKIKYIY